MEEGQEDEGGDGRREMEREMRQGLRGKEEEEEGKKKSGKRLEKAER